MSTINLSLFEIGIPFNASPVGIDIFSTLVNLRATGFGKQYERENNEDEGSVNC